MDETGDQKQRRSLWGQLALVAGIFTILGVVISAVVYWGAPSGPQYWTGIAVAGVSAGVGGAIGWFLFCGKHSRPAWWRVVLAGALAGLILHPVYIVLAGLLHGELVTVSDLLVGSMFFMLVAGIITVPSGIAAGFICRAVGGQREGVEMKRFDAMTLANTRTMDDTSPPLP